MKRAVLAPVDLLNTARTCTAQYRSADPYPHAVLDDLFPAETLKRVLAEFPDPDNAEWYRFDRTLERKLALAEEEQWGEETRSFLSALNAPPFLQFLEELTGIAGLIPDPYFLGGGLHQIEPGGVLAVHADFNRHRKLKLDRRINVLIYLNKDWEESYGGHLELWDEEMQQCVQKILPVFNRTVVFSTTSTSYHGHPEPLTCPKGRTRKSIAMYYYTNGRPEHERTAEHTTLYRRRKGEKRRITFQEIAAQCAPPILVNVVQHLKEKHRKRVLGRASR